MKKLVYIIILETFVLIILLLLLFLPKHQSISEVCFREFALSEQSESRGCFHVEVAKTVFQQGRGLMFRDHLDKNRGMLFIFGSEGIYPFWMKNTLIPLDIIWINQNKEVVFISENSQPCSSSSEVTEGQFVENCTKINPNQVAKYVLEINGGISRDINLKIGDKVSIR